MIMDQLVGDWKEFSIKFIEPCDYEKVLEHLRENFYHDEAICKLDEGNFKETAASYDRIVLDHVTHNLSFFATHKETQKVAAVRIIYESTQDEYSSSPACFKSHNGVFWSKDNTKHLFLTELEDKCNIFQMYGSPRCAQLHLASVAREFRCQGLATEMYKRGIAFLRRKGFTMAKGCFSDEISRKIVTKLGYRELARLYMKDLRSDGNPWFPNAENDQFTALMAIKF